MIFIGEAQKSSFAARVGLWNPCPYSLMWAKLSPNIFVMIIEPRTIRRVFHRVYAPPTAFAGPAAVGHIVRHVLGRAGIQRRGRGTAHLLRHGLATQMIRKGASLVEISGVLRHRSLNTTASYVQVSFEALRTVARAWSVVGGDR